MQDIIFVHGMFQNPKSWENWVTLFSNKGYNCVVPAWPMHDGEPAILRANPSPDLGKLRLAQVINSIELTLNDLNNPIMIGHSVGGLIVQIMLNRGMISAGVAIDSVAPNGMVDFDWSSIKNIATIANPVKGDEPIMMDAKTFHASFANTLSEAASAQSFEKFATHDSRNVLRDCMGHEGKIDLDKPHGPLLLIGGNRDEIIPAHLTEKNFKAYKDVGSVTDIKIFEERSHFICGEPGWEQVADYALNWLEQNATINVTDLSAGALKTDASHGNLR